MAELEPPSIYAEREVSLLDLWQVLVRRKLSIMFILAFSLAAAAAYLLLAPSRYEARATLRIGQVADAGALEEPEVLSAWLQEKYGEEISTGIKRPPPFLKMAAVQKNSKQMVDLTVFGETPEQAAIHLRNIAKDAIARHLETYNSEVDLARRRIEQIENQRDMLSELLASTTEQIDVLKKRDPVQASLLTQERGRITSELMAAGRELPLWQQKLNPPKTITTELLGDVVAPARPVSPKKSLVVTIAAMLGVMGGVLLAFVTEMMAEVRRRTLR